jgi:hypothetical protein
LLRVSRAIALARGAPKSRRVLRRHFASVALAASALQPASLCVVLRCWGKPWAHPSGAGALVELAHNWLGDRFLEASCGLSGKPTRHFL